MGKTCSSCKTPDADFGPNKARSDGLQVYCRACMRSFRLARGYDKARWERQRDEESARNREYRQANAHRIKQTDRERAARRREQAPATIRALNIARKHGERRATPVWAEKAAMNAVYERAKQLQEADGITRHVDHAVPLKHPMVCGLHVPANLEILTAEDNMRKHNRFEPWA